MATSKEDRLFNNKGRKHYRRTYNLTEVRIGIALLGVLVAIAGWVLYKGQHPDPEIYAASKSQINRAPTTAVDRGPVPEGLAMEGFREGELSTFDESNLYEKIDGREGYYKSYGFERLYFIAIARSEDPAQTVDIELYDLGNGKNALGAFSGEIPPGSTPDQKGGGLLVMDRNAFFMTRGKYYARGIGADESELVKKQLAFAAEKLGAGLAGEELPWSYALFVDGMGLSAGKVSYQPENAFGFGFAKDVHIALLEDDETEVFVVATNSEDEAAALAKSFGGGFTEYGEVAAEADGVSWVSDRYLNRVSGAKPSKSLVIGVRSAENLDAAKAALVRLDEATAKLPEGAAKPAAPAEAAEPAPGAPPEEGGYGEGGGEGGGEGY